MLVVGAALVGLPGCGDSGSSSADGTITRTVVTEVHTVTANAGDESPTETKEVRESSASPEPKSGSDGAFTMPNEVGKGLQDAQDHIQAVSGNPLYITSSTDATGQGRSQIIDRNWKVCAQNVAPGERVDEDSDISFAAVKLGESCP